MASSPLVLPGVLFVGEDDRARVVAHTGPAAGWFVPRGIKAWSSEVSVVAREALTDDIRRATKAVMPEEQIPPAKYPLTYAAAQKSPLVAVSSKLTSKLVEAGIRVHTIGADAITSSFYYLAEGGGEAPARAEGDIVGTVGAALGDSADNAMLDAVMDTFADRLLRTVSGGRVSELSLELAAALPRLAADGSGLQEVDLDVFERSLSQLVGASEAHRAHAQTIADRLAAGGGQVPFFGEARKHSVDALTVSMGSNTVALPAYERWTMAHAFDASKGEDAAAIAAKRAAEEAAAAERRAAEERAAAEAAAKRAAEERAAAERKAAADKAAAEKAAADKAAAEAAAKKAADEKAAADAAAKRAAEEAEKKAAEAKADADKKAAEEKAEADKKAAEAKAEADKKAAEEKAAAEKAAEKKKAAADDKAAAAKAETKKSDAPPKAAAAKKKPEAGKDAALAKAPEAKSNSMWVMLLVAAAVGAAVWKFFVH